AKSAADIIKETLDSALEQTSGNVAKLLTGQKPSWGKEFQDIGQQMVKSAVKSALQMGLGELGKIWAPAGKIADALGLNGKPDGSTPTLALWVRMADMAGYQVVGPPALTPNASTSTPANTAPGTRGWDLAPTQDIVLPSGLHRRAPAGSESPGGLGGIFDLLMGLRAIDIGGIAGGGASGSESVTSTVDFGMPIDDPGPPVLRRRPDLLNKSSNSGVLGALAMLMGGGLGGLGGGGGGEGIPDVTSSIDFGGFLADGGGVDPGRAYVVGEDGPEVFSPRASGSIVPNHALGGSTTVHYHVDARQADLGSANRIRRALEATHAAAVANSVRANSERAKRTPQRS
ncbi:MAG: hypothetical protein WBY44_34450, partial [Bryobacteraceae bacterium]